MPHQSIDNPHQTHRQPVHDMQETIDPRLQTVMRRLVARQPRLPGAQYAVSDKRQRPPRAPHHKPEKRRQVISIVNPQQRILQLTQIFTLIAARRYAVDQRQLAGHGIAGATVIARRRFQIGMIMQPNLACPDAQQAQQDPEHQQRYVK